MNLTDDRGSVTAFSVVFALTLLICAGLVVDGGAKIQAYREAYAVAEEAARAGAGQIDVDRTYAQGGQFEVDTSKAVAAARGYLASARHAGNVAMTGSRTIQVTVTVSKPTTLVSLIGIANVTATAKASARMFHGIEQGRP
ncbi:pilus assembly protein TadG-related protein [Microtetraspora malaysiensis]|uniref:Pilus assembly protein TadG-related protein n=1 Tax=Microtetraspora malaysiensis TaxID=161358 RepID=A0ABW6T2Y7_9ACTN